MKYIERFTCLLLIISSVLSFSSCSRTNLSQEFVIDKSNSYFSNFFVDGDVVKVYCHIEVNNLTGVPASVLIQGDFEEDRLGGLLTNRFLNAYRTDDQSVSSFLLEPGANSLDLVFIGEHGEYDVKQNRLLPQIMIVQLEEKTVGRLWNRIV